MIVLVLGGARSGKSEVGERVAARLGQPVCYVATSEIADPDMADRVSRHRARRPQEWSTVELQSPKELETVLASAAGTVLVDSLGGWLARFPGFDVQAPRLCCALRERSASTVLVSEEVGLGVHPTTEAGRRFRDRLGDLNRSVAGVSDEVLLVVAGRVLPLVRAGELA